MRIFITATVDLKGRDETNRTNYTYEEDNASTLKNFSSKLTFLMM